VAACTAGGICATAVFTWVTFVGRADPLAPAALGSVYDAQARSLLHGHWDVPASALLFERFKVGGKFYAYFGPWPAVLRMPVVAFTDAFDGRLSRVSMLLAFAVLLAFAGRTAWQARTVVRGPGPVGWRTLLAAGSFVFLTGCGSTALFLGSQAIVHHEAMLWGIAWSVAALSFVVAHLLHGRTSSLVWASVTATLAMMSRPSVGFGPVLALGLLIAVRLFQRVADWRNRGRDDARSIQAGLTRWLGASAEAARGSLWQVALATAVPLASYMYVNYAKFGSLLGVPIEKQDVLYALAPTRRAALAATGNSLFGVDYVPTNLVQYFRPDAIGFRSLFPWVTFGGRPHVFGGVVFDNFESTVSIPIMSAALFVLAVAGVAAAIKVLMPRSDATSGTPSTVSTAVYRIPLLAAALATMSVLAIADLLQRYEGDFVPLLVLGSAVGLFSAARWLSGRSGWMRGLVAMALIVAAIWSCLATLGLTLIYQREYDGFQSTAVRAAFISFQLDVNDALGFGRPSVRRGRKLPVIKGDGFRRTDAPHGQLFVVGNCEGLYISDLGGSWLPVEGNFGGHRRWRITFERPSPGSREPLWSAGTGPYQILMARWVDNRHVRLEYAWAGYPLLGVKGTKSWHVEPGHTYTLDLRLDPLRRSIEIKHDGDTLLTAFLPSFDTIAHEHLGAQPIRGLASTKFAGTIRQLSLTPICDRLTR